jgi:hypothetical protein
MEPRQQLIYIPHIPLCYLLGDNGVGEGNHDLASNSGAQGRFLAEEDEDENCTSPGGVCEMRGSRRCRGTGEVVFGARRKEEDEEMRWWCEEGNGEGVGGLGIGISFMERKGAGEGGRGALVRTTAW